MPPAIRYYIKNDKPVQAKQIAIRAFFLFILFQPSRLFGFAIPIIQKPAANPTATFIRKRNLAPQHGASPLVPPLRSQNISHLSSLFLAPSLFRLFAPSSFHPVTFVTLLPPVKFAFYRNIIYIYFPFRKLEVWESKESGIPDNNKNNMWYKADKNGCAHVDVWAKCF